MPVYTVGRDENGCVEPEWTGFMTRCASLRSPTRAIRRCSLWFLYMVVLLHTCSTTGEDSPGMRRTAGERIERVKWACIHANLEKVERLRKVALHPSYEFKSLFPLHLPRQVLDLPGVSFTYAKGSIPFPVARSSRIRWLSVRRAGERHSGAIFPIAQNSTARRAIRYWPRTRGTSR